MAPSSRQGQRPRNQRLRCARSPPTRSIPRQTPSRGRSARLRGCSAAVATLGSRTRRPPARCPPSIPCGAPSPRRLGTAPARAPGAHPPLRARPGRAEREFPSPTGVPHGAAPRPTAGSARAVPPACPACAPQHPARGEPPPRLGGPNPTASPRAAGSRPTGCGVPAPYTDLSIRATGVPAPRPDAGSQTVQQTSPSRRAPSPAASP